ncbi:MAG TPA: DUF1800 family protein [Casimicrobium sp.]|nr:DUF1800 family protein [Casimicrobium sp.]
MPFTRLSLQPRPRLLASPPLARVIAACALAVLPVAVHAVCPFNVAGGSAPDALRDGVLLVRYAQGLRGATLVAGTGANAATVEATIAANTAQLDMNGNGQFDVDDAAIIARNIFKFPSPQWVVPGAAGAYATRTHSEPVKAFVDANCVATTLAGTTTDQTQASRFLIQSTFGPSRADIASFMTLAGANHKARAGTWINTQFAMPRPAKHFQYLLDRKAEYDARIPPENFYSEMTREAFWKQALKSPDQLRQRLAFALSEVLVVSSSGGSDNPFELAAYLDLLADNGYGNFRDVLYKMSLSPAMGRYLSHLRNDGGSATPNENFARELLQLFAVGLVMLNPDGTPTTTPSYTEDTVKGFAKAFTGFSYDDPYCKVGDPSYAITPPTCIDTYGGVHPNWSWQPDATYPNDPNILPVPQGWARAMIPFPGRHSALSKQLLAYPTYSGVVSACTNAVALAAAGGLLPAINTAGSGVTTRTKVNAAQAYATVNDAIDNVFCHPNVGPFIGKHLIKFFVTSTPSPAYVGRVAAVFNNNGSGVRGDMQAVLRAVLLDDEAVTPATVLTTAPELMKFGKLREPILRLSSIFRAFNATATSGRYQLHYGLEDVEYGISQAPLQSPTVFNYFNPDFSPPGPVAQSNALGPEFQITTTTAIASTQNYFGGLVTRGGQYDNLAIQQTGIGSFGTCNISTVAANYKPADCVISDLSDLYAIQADSNALFDYLNLVLLGGQLSPSNKTLLIAALDHANAYPPCATPASLPACTGGVNNANWQNRKRDRVKGALWLAVHTPEFQIQR